MWSYFPASIGGECCTSAGRSAAIQGSPGEHGNLQGSMGEASATPHRVSWWHHNHPRLPRGFRYERICNETDAWVTFGDFLISFLPFLLYFKVEGVGWGLKRDLLKLEKNVLTLPVAELRIVLWIALTLLIFFRFTRKPYFGGREQVCHRPAGERCWHTWPHSRRHPWSFSPCVQCGGSRDG